MFFSSYFFFCCTLPSSPTRRSSDLELAAAQFSRGLGPGVYDIHSPRVPSTEEVAHLVRLADEQIGSGTLWRSEEHTSELQSRGHLVCRLLLEKKNTYEFFCISHHMS